MKNILSKFNEEQIKKWSKEEVDSFKSGDTIEVAINIYDDTGKVARVQMFRGVCIGRKNRGIHSSFIVRKISYNEGVEFNLKLYSPAVKSIKRLRRGHVRRSKIYYLRELRGKAARIKEIC